MTSQNSGDNESLRKLKVEEPLPVTAVGIESVKEGKPQTMSSHRRIYPWFARRPTAATRLAILSSVLPSSVSTQKLLKLMEFGPDVEVEDIEEYIIKKRQSEGDRDGSVEDHYGYKYPHRKTPTKNELDEFHNLLRNHWEGEVPTVLDPTAGGGTIPLESFRYGLPTISNELNPVAWLINKVLLEYAPQAGSLDSELSKWTGRVSELAKNRLNDYYPNRNGVSPNHYLRTYSTTCSSCGKRFPLTSQWWFNRKQGKAVKPQYPSDDEVSFRCVDFPEDVSDEEFDPDEGTVDGSEATCPHCNVVTERDELTKKFQNGEYEYETCAVRFNKKINGDYYHSVNSEDREAIERALEEVQNNLDYATLLQQDRYIGRQDRASPFGITTWRDLFSPRQLLAHAAYLEAFNEVKPKITEKYEESKAEALLVLLSFAATRIVNRNNRLIPLNPDGGSPHDLLGNNNYAFKWNFGETNPLAGTYSYEEEVRKVRTHYQTVANQVSDRDPSSVTVRQGDASSMPFDKGSVDAVIMDPPYGSNIMYSEMADALYVWLREYLQDIFPNEFSSPETNKEDEAVENSAIVNSDTESARQRYEQKMGSILSRCYDLLKPGGVITIYFTDRETETWDALTMSLINAGFVVTATHTITSEVPTRIAMRERAAADSTLLLTCRKPRKEGQDEGIPTLWSDIRDKTRQAARDKANDLFESELNLTKTDIIISSFGPTLRVFTENHPVVDKHDEVVRPNTALEEARSVVMEIILERELGETLEGVDSLTRWYIGCWLIHGRENIPYDDANQLGHGVGVDINDLKRDTKIWSKSKDTLILKGQSYRVQDYTALENGMDRRKRAYPIDPRDSTFEYNIDTVHASLNVISTKGSKFAWNWLNERNLQDDAVYRKTIKSLLQTLPENHDDYETLINLVSGETGELLDIDADAVMKQENKQSNDKTTLNDF